MTLRIALVSLLTLTAATACSSSDDSGTLQSDVANGGHTFDVKYEDAKPVAGADTNWVVKPSDDSKPDSVTAWIGTADREDTDEVDGVFDDGDGDFDIPIPVPADLAADALFVFQVTYSGSDSIATVDFQSIVGSDD